MATTHEKQSRKLSAPDAALESKQPLRHAPSPPPSPCQVRMTFSLVSARVISSVNCPFCSGSPQSASPDTLLTSLCLDCSEPSLGKGGPKLTSKFLSYRRGPVPLAEMGPGLPPGRPDDHAHFRADPSGCPAHGSAGSQLEPLLQSDRVVVDLVAGGEEQGDRLPAQPIEQSLDSLSGPCRRRRSSRRAGECCRPTSKDAGLAPAVLPGRQAVRAAK